MVVKGDNSIMEVTQYCGWITSVKWKDYIDYNRSYAVLRRSKISIVEAVQ